LRDEDLATRDARVLVRSAAALAALLQRSGPGEEVHHAMSTMTEELKSLWDRWTGSWSEERRVLVVDDDIDSVTTVSAMLRSAGYTTGMALDAVKALHLLQMDHYGVAIVDLWMPDKDGLQLLADIQRASPRTRVIIMTARGDWETRLDAIHGRAIEYLQKPLARTDLLALVGAAFEAAAASEPDERGKPRASVEAPEPGDVE
jgi:DNA-binding NtrC family response regulator